MAHVIPEKASGSGIASPYRSSEHFEASLNGTRRRFTFLPSIVNNTARAAFEGLIVLKHSTSAESSVPKRTSLNRTGRGAIIHPRVSLSSPAGEGSPMNPRYISDRLSHGGP